MSIDFNDSTLFISARSPFARRVRLALLENGIRFEERILDVFKPNSELTNLNPLARVPTLRLKTGEVLIDSEKIIQAFYLATPSSALWPRTESEQFLCSHWSALALGLAEKSVEYYLETLRPEETRDLELLNEVRDIAQRVLDRFDELIGARSTLLEGRLTQVDLDLGTALTYFSLRFSSQWKTRYRQTAEYLSRLEDRDSFRATRPPAA